MSLADGIAWEKEFPPDQDARKGDWIFTASGRQFWALDPRAEEIHIEDVAHALSMQCRWGGMVHTWYSVAEHCVRVAEILPPEQKLAGLLHDAAEAYLVDLPRPIKRSMPIYDEAEARIFRCVAERFGIPDVMSAEIHRADGIICETERRDLMPAMPVHLDKSRTMGAEPLPGIIYPWTQADARRRFLQSFVRYS